MNKKKTYKVINKFLHDSKEERDFKIADIIARIINSNKQACCED